MNRVRATLVALALAAAIVVAAPSNSQTVAEPTLQASVPPAIGTVAPADRFGINGQGLFWQQPPALWPEHLRLMRTNGIRIVRTDAFWDVTEPYAPSNGVHQYRWGRLDAIAGSLAANGLRWLPIVDYSAPWAASQKDPLGKPLLHSPPADVAAFAAYAQALARRYGPGGAFWQEHPSVAAVPVSTIEIWNEENGSVFWEPNADPSAYARLYELARDAIHRVGPSIEVLVGGLTNPAAPFLQGMYAALGNAAGRIDGVAIHPYAGRPADMLPGVIATRSVLDSHGDIDTPIDVTEYGWPVEPGVQAGPWVSEQQRAAYLQQFTATIAGADCGVERTLPHTWVTAEQNRANPEDWFGLVHPNGTLTPSATAYLATIGQLERSPAPGPPSSICARPLSVQGRSTQLTPQVSGAGSISRPHRKHRRRRAAHRGARHRGAPHRGARHGHARHRHGAVAPTTGVRLWGACAQAAVKSRSTAVDAALVTFTLLPRAGVQPPRGPLTIQARSDRSGIASACWRTATPTSGTVTITAQRADFASAPSTTVPLTWGPASAPLP